MLQYVQLLQPGTVEEAQAMFKKQKMATVLAGGCWTRMSRRAFPAAIDLSGLGLRYIKEESEYYAIGAMATQWDVERFEAFQTFANGLLVKMVQPILGIQFRNTATIGGSVAARFGFSDIIPTLLALRAEVVLAESGVMSLEDYMSFTGRELLLEVRVPKAVAPAAAVTYRKSTSDFPFLTGSLNVVDGVAHLYIGCRPQQPKLAVAASQLLTEKGLEAAAEAGALAAEELKFETNSHASAAYRQAMTKVLVQEMAKEVLAWK